MFPPAERELAFRKMDEFGVETIVPIDNFPRPNKTVHAFSNERRNRVVLVRTCVELIDLYGFRSSRVDGS